MQNGFKWTYAISKQIKVENCCSSALNKKKIEALHAKGQLFYWRHLDTDALLFGAMSTGDGVRLIQGSQDTRYGLYFTKAGGTEKDRWMQRL